MTGKVLVKQGGRLLADLATGIPSNGIISVGSDASSTIRLENGSIAPEQFVIACDGGRLTLLARSDGSAINGEMLPAGSIRDIRPGDVVTAGDYSFIQESEERAAQLLAVDSAPAASPMNEDVFRVDRPQAFEGGLSEVLSNLRAEERFYFQIENGTPEPQRIHVEKEEMWLGWSQRGKCVLSVDTSDIAVPRAQIRKDWSGVVLYPLQTRGIWLDDQFLAKPHRLKNDDLFSLLTADGKKVSHDVVVRFHEPTALLVLNSILPKELPPPVPMESSIGLPLAVNTGSVAQVPAQPKEKFLLFGYFSIGEILILAAGTILTAIITFLVLVFF